MKHNPGIGATDELSLRVSIATLVRVLFQDPDTGEGMLALERKATLRGQTVDVKAQPFGGAVRIRDMGQIHELSGGFQFDSERSRVEQDFRIFIRPSAWKRVKAYCLDQFQASKEAVFETSPERELEEELYDSLGIHVHPGQYRCKPLWTVVEDTPSATMNIHAELQPTVRMYGVFEAQIVDAALWNKIRSNSEMFSTQDLQDRALEDRRNGGKGRANACMVVRMEALRRFYSLLPLKERDAMVSFEGTKLENNTSVLLDDILSLKYKRYIK